MKEVGAGSIVVIQSRGPFDLSLSLQAAASFLPVAQPTPTLTVLIQSEGRPLIIEICQPSGPNGTLHAVSAPALPRARLRRMAKWLVCADVDLRRFYQSVKSHPVMGPVIRSLNGLKPIRPPTLFEMAVIAITEQQLSLAAAFHIRSRIVRKFGTPFGRSWIFPTPERLADAPLEALWGCGLSRRKAEYVRGLAKMISEGTLDIEGLRSADDRCVREVLMDNPGFGQWSVDYFLSRGLGRPDCLPSGDTGLRRVIGQYFSGRRLTAAELEHALAPFAPYRGLAAYYLAVHWRLKQGGKAVND